MTWCGRAHLKILISGMGFVECVGGWVVGWLVRCPTVRDPFTSLRFTSGSVSRLRSLGLKQTQHIPKEFFGRVTCKQQQHIRLQLWLLLAILLSFYTILYYTTLILYYPVLYSTLLLFCKNFLVFLPLRRFTTVNV